MPVKCKNPKYAYKNDVRLTFCGNKVVEAKKKSDIVKKKSFKEKPYLIYQLYSEKNIKKAEKELRDNGNAYYVYFETPFQIRYVGFTYKESAKKTYRTIMKKNKDLYGCVVSVENLY